MLSKIIDSVAQQIAANEKYLNDLDAVMGDGEHGSNMTKCFGAVKEMLPSLEGQSDVQILKNTGMRLLTAPLAAVATYPCKHGYLTCCPRE